MCTMLIGLPSLSARKKDADQIRTKSSDGANLKEFREDSVARSCSGALKGVVALMVGLSAHTEPMKFSTEIALILRSHNRSTRLLVEASIVPANITCVTVPINTSQEATEISWCTSEGLDRWQT